MKTKFDLNSVVKDMSKYKKFFIDFLILAVVGVIGYSLYTVLITKEDQAIVKQYSEKSKEMNISFDRKYLQDLGTKKSPIEVSATSGRNPFLNY